MQGQTAADSRRAAVSGWDSVYCRTCTALRSVAVGVSGRGFRHDFLGSHMGRTKLRVLSAAGWQRLGNCRTDLMEGVTESGKFCPFCPRGSCWQGTKCELEAKGRS